ncbi:hypothetical protein RSWS8N_18274 [Cereibacter sphaeroides WS8N]|nr:hypothetical protein RSWS8N_17984 [Cereibacter sphaeroides WS8N]EGJ20133.1 hypothetical protein RSWS8N_18274 [Cereibacter sphaeroides WS8N]
MTAQQIFDELGMWPGTAYTLAARRSAARRRCMHMSLADQLFLKRIRRRRTPRDKQNRRTPS